MLLQRENTALVVVDIQERLAKIMDQRDPVVKNTGILIQAAKRLGVPVVATLQYPKGLGPVVDELEQHLADAPHVEKNTFDCCGESGFTSALEGLKPKSVVLTGMETHICVLQSALSLREKGFNVHVVQDAVCSRSEENRRNGLSRMEKNGVEVTNTESVLFELLGAAGTPEFKELSKLIK